MVELSKDSYKGIEQKKVLTANDNDAFAVNNTENIAEVNNNLTSARKLYTSPVFQLFAFNSIDMIRTSSSINTEEKDNWEDDPGDWG